MNCTVIYCVSVFPFTLCGCSNWGNSRYKTVAVAQVAGEAAQLGMSIRTCLTAEGCGTKFLFWGSYCLCVCLYIKQMGTRGRRPPCLCPWFRLPVRVFMFEGFSGVPSLEQSVFRLHGLVDERSVFMQSPSEKGWKFTFTFLFCFFLYQPKILLMFSISIPPPLVELDCY